MKKISLMQLSVSVNLLLLFLAVYFLNMYLIKNDDKFNCPDNLQAEKKYIDRLDKVLGEIRNATPMLVEMDGYWDFSWTSAYESTSPEFREKRYECRKKTENQTRAMCLKEGHTAPPLAAQK